MHADHMYQFCCHALASDIPGMMRGLQASFCKGYTSGADSYTNSTAWTSCCRRYCTLMYLSPT